MSGQGSEVVGMDQARPRHLLVEADPARFLDAFFELLTRPVDILLVDPGLPLRALDELEQREGAVRFTGGSARSACPPDKCFCFAEGWPDEPSPARVFVPTGGTTGAPRFARHDRTTLVAAAQGFARVFPGPAHSLCLLPLWHVGGLMQAVRARVTKGRLRLANWDAVRSGEGRSDPHGFFLSLVPTQLERLMGDESAVIWLKGFRAVFLGGGPSAPGLLERARAEGIPLAPAYGLTETAALVTVMMPADFLAGGAGVGRPLPHASVAVVDEGGECLPAGSVGRIRVSSESLFYGYGAEDRREADPFLTGDLGRMDAEGCLTVVGRADEVIISGGEKILPGEVEAAIREAGLAVDVAVFGRPDDRWGEVVCAVLSGGDFVDGASARAALRSVLPGHKIPRYWLQVDQLPRNRMGKLDRGCLTEMMEDR